MIVITFVVVTFSTAIAAAIAWYLWPLLANGTRERAACTALGVPHDRYAKALRLQGFISIPTTVFFVGMGPQSASFIGVDQVIGLLCGGAAGFMATLFLCRVANLTFAPGFITDLELVLAERDRAASQKLAERGW